MKILVTGGSGFLGSHIADALSNGGHQVKIFDRITSPWLRPDQEMILGDIMNASLLSDALKDCEVVYHLAALADINEAINLPRKAIEINIIGTLNVLEAARINHINRVIFSSSIYVFSNQGSFYRTTKQACENLVEDYRDRYGLKFTTLRFGSLYGPRADKSNGINKILNQALTNKRIDYYGDGKEVREYIHVLDAAAMSLEALDEKYQDQYLHLAGTERMTSRDMLDLISEIMGGKIEINFRDKSQAGHYHQTPYSFTPKIGRRIIRSSYIDLGLGILDCLQSLHGSMILD